MGSSVKDNLNSLQQNRGNDNTSAKEDVQITFKTRQWTRQKTDDDDREHSSAFSIHTNQMNRSTENRDNEQRSFNKKFVVHEHVSQKELKRREEEAYNSFIGTRVSFKKDNNENKLYICNDSWDLYETDETLKRCEQEEAHRECHVKNIVKNTLAKYKFSKEFLNWSRNCLKNQMIHDVRYFCEVVKKHGWDISCRNTEIVFHIINGDKNALYDLSHENFEYHNCNNIDELLTSKQIAANTRHMKIDISHVGTDMDHNDRMSLFILDFAKYDKINLVFEYYKSLNISVSEFVNKYNISRFFGTNGDEIRRMMMKYDKKHKEMNKITKKIEKNIKINPQEKEKYKNHLEIAFLNANISHYYYHYVEHLNEDTN